MLSDNRIKATRAAQFPLGLKMLIMAKNGIGALDLYDFPAKLKTLQLDGNDISNLKGAVLPDTLESLYVGHRLFSPERSSFAPGFLLVSVMWVPVRARTARSRPSKACGSRRRCRSCTFALVNSLLYDGYELTSHLSVVLIVLISMISGATVTNFIARQSDIAVLAKAQVSLTSTVPTECAKGGKWTAIADGAGVCAMDGACVGG